MNFAQRLTVSLTTNAEGSATAFTDNIMVNWIAIGT